MSYDREQVDFGWDLPPGVYEGMIPGNRPEDIQFEQAMEESFELLDAAKELIADFIECGFGEDFEYVLKEWMKEREIKL